jgi:Tol biopolymer transport system component
VRHSGEISSARWTPRGDGIYYFRRDGQTTSLFKAEIDDKGTPIDAGSPLMSGLEADGSFSLSADGTRLVYARDPFHSNLWLLQVSADGSNRILRKSQLTGGTSLIERPRISPDGKQVLFNMGREGSSELYTIPLAGGEPKRLTFLNAFSLGGAWSGDGRAVAFASSQGGKPRVWTINTDGGQGQAISSGEMSDSFEIAWAPGGQILYQQIRNRNFYILNPETRQERFLLSDTLQGWIFSPVASRDGSRLAVSWNRQPDRGLWIVDIAGRQQRHLYKKSIPIPLGWSRDESFIYAIEGKRAAYRGVTVNLGETITEARVLEIATDGSGLRSSFELPFEEIGGVAVAPDSRTFVCTVFSSRSDVWIADNFDAPASDH